MSEKVDQGRATEARLRKIIQKRGEFLATAIGRAFNEFECLIYCSADRDKRRARTELLKLLYEVSGVGEYDDGR